MKHTPPETSPAIYFENFIFSDSKPGLTEKPVGIHMNIWPICDMWYYIPRGNTVWHNP